METYHHSGLAQFLTPETFLFPMLFVCVSSVGKRKKACVLDSPGIPAGPSKARHLVTGSELSSDTDKAGDDKIWGWHQVGTPIIFPLLEERWFLRPNVTRRCECLSFCNANGVKWSSLFLTARASRLQEVFCSRHVLLWTLVDVCALHSCRTLTWNFRLDQQHF